MYAHGRGVPQNYDAAARWMRLAANRNLRPPVFSRPDVRQRTRRPADSCWLTPGSISPRACGRRERDYWTRVRDSVASKMSLAQLAESTPTRLRLAPTRAAERSRERRCAAIRWGIQSIAVTRKLRYSLERVAERRTLGGGGWALAGARASLRLAKRASRTDDFLQHGRAQFDRPHDPPDSCSPSRTRLVSFDS